MVNTLTMKDIPLWIYEGTIRLRVSRQYLLIYVIFRKYIKEMYTTKQKDCNKLENLDLSYFNINLSSLNQQIEVEMHKF